ncbi:hypothetical protein ACO22_02918 [Paracoccidioides brasiliensis]|uniref:Protein kinase domain-containing protein n=1 Tax=Paracoccidioides brasiliensis TaxID=121759 RepID=A0A1D2JHB8_PARBR|nr:hypothetical protein ACO22_02918 [Paracoccidioides brasiliensis]
MAPPISCSTSASIPRHPLSLLSLVCLWNTHYAIHHSIKLRRSNSTIRLIKNHVVSYLWTGFLREQNGTIGSSMLLREMARTNLAFVKTAAPNDQHAKENLKRECENYLLIALGACFRKMCDAIGDPTNISNSDGGGISYAAFEWLETTLADVEHRPGKHYKAANPPTYCSLTLTLMIYHESVFQSGSRCSAQPYAMRAPELWQGQPCTQPSQVWALAAMLLCWMKPGILGTGGCPTPMIRESWCIAKLMRLFPSWTVPPLDNDVRQCEFSIWPKLSSTILHQRWNRFLFWRMSCEIVHMPIELINLLHFMLIVNPDERPSAIHVLASNEFLALEKAVQNDIAHTILAPPTSLLSLLRLEYYNSISRNRGLIGSLFAGISIAITQKDAGCLLNGLLGFILLNVSALNLGATSIFLPAQSSGRLGSPSLP